MTTLARGQVWQSTVDGFNYQVMRTGVGQKEAGALTMGVLYMAQADVQKGLPEAPLYFATEAVFTGSFILVG